RRTARPHPWSVRERQRHPHELRPPAAVGPDSQEDHHVPQLEDHTRRRREPRRRPDRGPRLGDHLLRRAQPHILDPRPPRRAPRAPSAGAFVERTAWVAGAAPHEADGPDNGPPLLLIHGQMVDWTTYLRTLPELSQHFHVFVVDCYGHGRSDHVPERYSNVAMGRDLTEFVRTEIGEPAVVSGNSSGGLLAIQIANEAPDLVRSLILEDPPLFSSLYP